MGWNTVAVLFNDMADEWPPRMQEAMRTFQRRGQSLSERGWFGFGQIASMDHADGTQVVVAGGNTARAVTMLDPASEDDLNALAMVLRAHGYSVKRPGRTRSEGPLSWGFWAKSRASTSKEDT